MSWASHEDFIAEVPVMLEELPLCIECEERVPLPGGSHCQRCFDEIYEETEALGAAIERLPYRPTVLASQRADLPPSDAAGSAPVSGTADTGALTCEGG